VSAGAAEGGGVANTVLLATRNAGKLAELRRMLGGGPVEIVGLADVPAFPDAPETGATFAENALAKARDAAAATGLPAVADDSGLAVEALNGMPARSARRRARRAAWCGVRLRSGARGARRAGDRGAW
jgi:XTP/dITP diphosphohydrolase